MIARFWKDRTANAAAEFALAIPFFMLIVMGLVQGALLISAQTGVKHAVGESARFATIYPGPTDNEIRNYVLSDRFGLDSERITRLQVSRGTEHGTDYAEIAVDYVVPIELVLMDGGSITVTETRRAYLP